MVSIFNVLGGLKMTTLRMQIKKIVFKPDMLVKSLVSDYDNEAL